MKYAVAFLLFLSLVSVSLGTSPLDSVSSNLRIHVAVSMDKQESQAVVVRTYEAENYRSLSWFKISSPELKTGRATLEKRHIVFWLQSGNAPLAERFSMALELPYQERSWASERHGEWHQAEPVYLQINGYSNIVEFVSSLSKAKAKMDQWMNVAFEKEITNLVKRIPSISFSLSEISDARPLDEEYYVDKEYGVTRDPGFSPVSYSPLAGFNVEGSFFYTMIINAKPYKGEGYTEKMNEFKPFLVIATEKRHLKYIAEYLESVKGKRVDQFGAIEKTSEHLALASSPISSVSWHELDDGTCVLPEFTTKRVMADSTILVPKTLISYNDVVKLIPLLNPNLAARELQKLQQQHNRENSIRKKSNDLFR